jgi:hypothetical protein
MGIFGFFKKKKEVAEVREIEVVSQDNLFEWILNKKKEYQEKEQEFLVPIKERIFQFVSELNSEISILEGVNIDEKKVDHRIKLIVKENLRNYIRYLEKMIERLNEIYEREKIVEKINFIFEDFNKKSRMSYEKITFIVGKEMQATKESIKKFLSDLGKIFKDNEKDFEEGGIVDLVEEKIERLKKFKEENFKLEEFLNEDIEKLKILKDNLSEKEKKLFELRESDKYREEGNKVKEFELKKQELQRNFKVLNSLIDFKALSNFYHKFENEMKLVKEYRENFKQILKRANMEEFVLLLKEAKLDNEKILEMVEKINIVKKQISEIIIDDLGVGNLERDIQRIKSEVQMIEFEKLSKEKKLKSFEDNLSRVLGEIKRELSKIGVEVE